jgi:hypothetical protein
VAVSTAFQIFAVTFLAAIVRAILVKKGWWPDWEKRALRREEHKRVLLAYEEWCKHTGTRPAADPRLVDKLIAETNGKVGPVG